MDVLWLILVAYGATMLFHKLVRLAFDVDSKERESLRAFRRIVKELLEAPEDD